MILFEAGRKTRLSVFPTRAATNWPAQSQEKDRSLKFWNLDEEKLYYPRSETKSHQPCSC